MRVLGILGYHKGQGWSIQPFLICLCLQSLCSLTWSESGPQVTTEVPACNSCPPGYGVVTVCNKTHDTRCAPCPQGTYNARYTLDFPCIPCSHCKQYEYQRLPCTTERDTVCASCFSKTTGGYGNEDFNRNCESLLTTTTTRKRTTKTTENVIFFENEAPLLTTTTTTETTENVVLQSQEEEEEEEEEEEGSGDLEPGMLSLPVKKPTSTSSTVSSKPPTPPPTTGKTTTETSTASTTASTATTTLRINATSIGPPVKPEGINEEQFTTIEDDEATTGSIEVPIVGEKRAEEGEGAHHKGYFEWPVVIAAAVAGLVCFVLGILVSALVHKHRSASQERLADSVDDDQATTTMITPRRGYPTTNNKYPDETGEARTPMFNGKHYN